MSLSKGGALMLDAIPATPVLVAAMTPAGSAKRSGPGAVARASPVAQVACAWSAMAKTCTVSVTRSRS